MFIPHGKNNDRNNDQKLHSFDNPYPTNIYLLKVNDKNTGKACKKCSKLIIKTVERCHCSSSGFFIVNFEHISHLFLLFLVVLLLNLNSKMFIDPLLIFCIPVCKETGESMI